MPAVPGYDGEPWMSAWTSQSAAALGSLKGYPRETSCVFKNSGRSFGGTADRLLNARPCATCISMANSSPTALLKGDNVSERSTARFGEQALPAMTAVLEMACGGVDGGGSSQPDLGGEPTTPPGELTDAVVSALAPSGWTCYRNRTDTFDTVLLLRPRRAAPPLARYNTVAAISITAQGASCVCCPIDRDRPGSTRPSKPSQSAQAFGSPAMRTARPTR